MGGPAAERLNQLICVLGVCFVQPSAAVRFPFPNDDLDLFLRARHGITFSGTSRFQTAPTAPPKTTSAASTIILSAALRVCSSSEVQMSSRAPVWIHSFASLQHTQAYCYVPNCRYYSNGLHKPVTKTGRSTKAYTHRHTSMPHLDSSLERAIHPR